MKQTAICYINGDSGHWWESLYFKSCDFTLYVEVLGLVTRYSNIQQCHCFVAPPAKTSSWGNHHL